MDPMEWDGRSLRREGFVIDISAAQDEWGDNLDHLGKWTDRWEEGALDHHRKSLDPRARDHGRWFIPAYSVADRRLCLWEAGYSKQVAAEMARAGVEKDYERADAYGREWWNTCICVTAARCGVELASHKVWGYASDEDIEECDIDEIIDEAVAQAQEKLEELLNTISPLEQIARTA